jgi:hypothetical protein
MVEVVEQMPEAGRREEREKKEGGRSRMQQMESADRSS